MDNHQAVTKSPWLRIESYSPGYTAISVPRKAPSFTHVPTSRWQTGQVTTQD
jgi:hypothetical protein